MVCAQAWTALKDSWNETLADGSYCKSRMMVCMEQVLLLECDMLRKQMPQSMSEKACNPLSRPLRRVFPARRLRYVRLGLTVAGKTCHADGLVKALLSGPITLSSCARLCI